MSSERQRRTTSQTGKADRRTAARAELARAQEQARRRSRLLVIGGAIVAIALVVVVVVVLIGQRSGSGGGHAVTPADQGIVAAVTGVPAATYDKVGAGSGIQAQPKEITAPALTAGGKPKVLYIGAEYCPFCAAERWAVVEALSRFGTFSGLGQTASSSDDIDPDTATLTFHGATYSSRYLVFTGVEIQGNEQGKPLDTPSAADKKLLSTYDDEKYTGARTGSIPFLDLGGRWVSAGASYDPQLLAGMTHEEIADALADPDSKVAQAIDGTANLLTAHLCELTGQKPAAVCTSAGVTAAK